MSTDDYQIRLFKIAEEDFTEIVKFIVEDYQTAIEAIANIYHCLNYSSLQDN